MAMFLLSFVEHDRAEELEERLKEKAVLHKEVSKGCFALSSATAVTPHDMYEALGMKDDEFGQLLIVRFDSYWGFHDTSLWDWFKGVREAL